MKLLWTLFLLAWFNATALAVESPAIAPTVDFHQALERALEKSPEFQVLKLKMENAKLETKNAWAVLLPTVDLQASHAYNEQNTSAYFTPVFRHAPWSNQAGLTVSENLYDNGLSWRHAKSAELNEQLQTLVFESARSRLLISVAKAYYDYSLAVAVIELQRQQIQTLKAQFRTIESRYQQGMSSNRDFLRIKAQGQSSEISLLTQEIEVNRAKQTLRLAIGESEATEFKPLVLEKNFRLESVAGVNHAVVAEDSYEFRIAELQEKNAAVAYESARRLEWPRLSLRGSYNYTVPQYIGDNIAGVDDPYWNLQLMVVLDYRLWDWGSNRRNVVLAENLQRIENQNQVSSRLKVRQDLIQLEAQLQILKRSFVVSQQILSANQEAYESLNRGYRDGKISYLELITALNTVYSSRSQDLSLRFNILKSQVDWAYYQGNVDEVLKSQ